ncbi:MAG: immunoglobulin-like domain-containing protein [Thomasclavelia spiroformis]
MKKKQVLAVSSALMIGTTTTLTGLPTPVMAQENTEVVQEAIVEENKNTEVTAGSIAIDEAHFPDKVFREQFIAKFDKDGDNVLSADEISEAKDLDLHDMTTISSLEGIQYLTNLQSLSIDRSSISDLSPVTNSSLKELNCNSSKVTNVDLTRYPNLEVFTCPNTSISSLDVSKNKKLYMLFVYNTPISKLDVTNNPNLKQLSCNKTGVTELDVTHNPQLATLDIGDTKVKTLDVSKNPLLHTLVCYQTEIDMLNVSNNLDLKELSCFGTNITELDVTKNTKLTDLNCLSTPIKALDLSNNLELERLSCSGILEQGIRGLDISKNTKIKELRCHDLYWLNVGDNKVLENYHDFVSDGYIDIKGNKIDLKKDVEQGIDISKVKVTANGTLDKDTGIITVDNVKKPVTYEYDCGTYKDGNVVLKVELSLNSQGEDNTAPTISANDVTLNVGDTFDPLANVTATDKEDGTITLTKDNIVANDVDTSKAGTYHVTYKVTDKNGTSAEKTITVTVKQNTGDLNSAPTISANDIILNVGDMFDPLANVTATDKEDGTITLTKDNIIANDVDTSKAGTYHVTFRVVDKNGAITEKTITVTVKEKATNKPVSPQQPQNPNKPTTPTNPSGQKNPVKTGDMTNIGLFASMFAGSTGALAVLFGKKRKRNKND